MLTIILIALCIALIILAIVFRILLVRNVAILRQYSWLLLAGLLFKLSYYVSRLVCLAFGECVQGTNVYTTWNASADVILIASIAITSLGLGLDGVRDGIYDKATKEIASGSGSEGEGE